MKNENQSAAAVCQCPAEPAPAETLKEKYMKLSRISVGILGAALLVAPSVFANNMNKASLDVSERVNVNGQTLDPGKYRVEWESSGPTVQVKLVQGKKTVATFPAQLQEQPNANPADAYGSSTEPNGTKELTAIYVGGKHEVLRIQNGSGENGGQRSQTQQPTNPSSK